MRRRTAIARIVIIHANCLQIFIRLVISWRLRPLRMALSTRGSRFITLAPAGLTSFRASAAGSAAATVLVSVTFAAFFTASFFTASRLAFAARGKFVGFEVAWLFAAPGTSLLAD
jgi:hypothetical protein